MNTRYPRTAVILRFSTLALFLASRAFADPSPARGSVAEEVTEDSHIYEEDRRQEESSGLDHRVRRALVELLAGETRDTDPDDTREEIEPDASDEELRASVRRVLQQLLDDAPKTKGKPIRTAAGVPVEPVKSDAVEEESEPEPAAEAPEATMVAQAQEAADDAEQERSRTVYDEAPDLIQSVDQVTFGGFVQMALNNFIGDHPTVGEYEIPRARLDVRGAAAEGFSYRIFWDLNRAGATLEDAWLEYSPLLIARSRVGQLKVPFSLEALNSARWIRFSERAMGPLNLAPFRDVGFNVFGRALDGRLEYAAGIFNGSFAKGAANAGTEKAVRVSWQAARLLGLPVSQGVHLGAAFTHRDVNGSLAAVDYETSSHTTFFRYRQDTRQSGSLRRLGLELEWIQGPWSVTGEYMRTRRQELRRGEFQSSAIESQSAYVATSWIFTGEEQTRNRPISPLQRIDRKTGTWGAFDVHARWDYFDTDPQALDLGLADGTDRVWALTGGLNWWPRTNLRTVLEFEYASFDDPVQIDQDTITSEWVFKLLTQFEF